MAVFRTSKMRLRALSQLFTLAMEVASKVIKVHLIVEGHKNTYLHDMRVNLITT